MSKSERFKIYIAAYLILKQNGQVLLHKRQNSGYQDGNYSLVAGHLDGGETAKQCIIREAKEETGISLSPNDIKVAYVMHHLAPDREYIDIYLSAERWVGEVANMEPKKCLELTWAPLDALPNNILPDVKQALEQIELGNFYGEYGW